MPAKNYDYIFLGAGCASLSIIMRMIDSNKFDQKKILLMDREPKTKNDRTWCFWEKGPGFFEDIVYSRWDHLLFKTGNTSIPLNIGSYEYKMIRGIDFYNKCFSVIKTAANIDIVYGEISFEKGKEFSILKINNKLLARNSRTIVFNSLYIPTEKQPGKFYLLQHFKGWIIEAAPGSLDARPATLMDFRVSQNNGTAFVYVLPLSPTRALVEYTLFTENVLPVAAYDLALKNYLREFLGLDHYTILDEEFGIIPMTNASFPFFKDGMYYIGTAGGQTKASTGYTFNFIQKQAGIIVQELLSGRTLSNQKAKKRFLFYDSTLLHILSKNLLPGKTIFSDLFKKNQADKVLKFLDNETSISEEIRLLNSLPKKVFIKAGFIEFGKMLFSRRKS
ncbi:MAG: lycopene cyclase family protein [Ginsengibacter sp.]